MAEAILKKEIVTNKAVSRFIAVSALVTMTSLGAFVRIPLPFTPVPLTLQTFFVLLGAACLGSRLSLSAQLGYIFLGVWGLPIFSGLGSGWVYLFGPTGGYLLGFLLASYFIGKSVRQLPNNFLLYFVLFSLADFLLLGCGVAWLKIIYGYPLGKLLAIGFLPFIPGDLLKALAASFIYGKLKSRWEKIF